ncbi:hypothetical protein IHY64_000519 [Salmonella enterica]|uniref:Uncharacterized protein n=3 Tax=Salmonella enterica TaxID=28901 RepID=A0A735RHC0_SALDZ|nr:hypothetical protein [Salmonella enterica]ECG8626260.1 hypothetical protein [Salmonella enterica subsp. diarizonae]EDO5261057.1 hypothetical protein [Salmonella enterica subsp. enterica serovar Newport]EDQ7102544.1 hypothetical protein [Salmonella enterica subsp. houtenae serovar 48:g,z51:-]EFB5629662.1 hypothetical protein [Salmonella enterica subsp. enterica serovar Litchfield]EFO5650446.1 hypothetical protein [Salmonella enterica subsp. enterica serovar Miami]EHB9162737.1 hypothetical p
MTILSVKLTKTSNTAHVVNALLLICCQLNEGGNIAHLFGDEVSDISPRQNVQSLPARTAKILSEISRRGLFFRVAPHGENNGIYIATHPKNLSRIA